MLPRRESWLDLSLTRSPIEREYRDDLFPVAWGFQSNMRMFSFDPASFRDAYREQGYVHITGGVTPEFLETMRGFVAQSFSSHEVKGTAIGGDKTQALFEFPENADFPGEFFDMVSSMCGLDRANMTLSERHVKAYESDAPPNPRAHKDRVSSKVSVGLSIDIPPGSTLILYPDDDRSVNPFNVAPALLQSLEPDRQPDVVLKTAREVAIEDRPGDVIVFAGSSTWHLRRNSASAVNMYLKVNDFDSDPLGEDPSTERRRADTADILKKPESADGVGSAVASLSRRLDTVTRQLTRNDWQEVVQANIWNERPVALSEVDVALLRAIDGPTPVAEIVDRLGGDGHERSMLGAAVRRLADQGVIDLRSSDSP